MKIVLAGGTGALGRRLADDLGRRGADVVILTRSPRAGIAHRQVAWDGRTPGEWAAELEGAVVVNLAGELVDRRPTAGNVALLERSRVEPTRALVEASARLAVPPVLWLQMSTLAVYGDAGDTVIDEQHPPAAGPPQQARVARAWEQAVEGAKAERLVVLRTGIVLDAGTPALDRLTTLTRWGLGGRMGRGDQWVSWIHAEDFRRAVEHIVDHPEIDGIVHMTSPNPVRNRDMMAALRARLHRRWSPPVPGAVVRLGALLMRTDAALALTGRRCLPSRLEAAGFAFAFPDLAGALDALLARPDR